MVPHDVIIQNVRRLATELETLREMLNEPIIILSGFRCFTHNKEVGGVKNSQHMLGLAVDIYVKSKTPHQIFLLARQRESFYKGGIGQYPRHDFTHLDIRENGPARWQG
jgi:uncharacterized protein YcbK (DUF882 family)